MKRWLRWVEPDGLVELVGDVCPEMVRHFDVATLDDDVHAELRSRIAPHTRAERLPFAPDSGDPRVSDLVTSTSSSPAGKISTPPVRVIGENLCTGIPIYEVRRLPFLTTEHISPGRMSSPSPAVYLHSGELNLSPPATTQDLSQFQFVSKEAGLAATTAAYDGQPRLIEILGSAGALVLQGDELLDAGSRARTPSALENTRSPAVSDVSAHQRIIEMSPGDVLVCYTDGAFEGRDRMGTAMGLRNLEHLMHRQPPPRNWPQYLTAAVEKHTAGRSEDDVLVASLSFLTPRPREARAPRASRGRTPGAPDPRTCSSRPR